MAIVGIWLVIALNGLAVKLLQPKAGPGSFAIRKHSERPQIRHGHYRGIIYLRVNPSVAIAGGAVTGLAVGLGTQLVISNFFS